jgi:hypothetical protein
VNNVLKVYNPFWLNLLRPEISDELIGAAYLEESPLEYVRSGRIIELESTTSKSREVYTDIEGRIVT